MDMTSKSLFFKLMKEDFKTRVWTLAISILIFFFSLIVATAMMISFNLYNSSTYNYSDDLAMNFMSYIGINNPFFGIIFIVLSLVMAMSGFSYLYSKKKVDLYHSLPVKREVLYFIKLINGILIVVIPFIICEIVASLLVIANTGKISVLIAAIWAIAEWTLLFILSYFLTLFSIMLTGNMLIGILACGFFSFYFPLISLVLKGYQSSFFDTYYTSGFIIENVLPNMSSFMLMFNIFELKWLTRIIIVILASIAFLFINLFLYKKRASEAAGKSVSFNVIKLPIKAMMVIFISILMYLLGYEVMNDSIGWGLFGLIVSGAITHCVMEIIYNQDFKKIFAKKIELLVLIIISIFIAAAFQFDIFGYDSYIPSASQIKSTAVISDLLESNSEQYYNKVEISDGYYDESFVDVDYASDSKIEADQIKKMDIQNKDAVLELARQGIEAAKYDLEPQGDFDRVLISYKLKNGRTVGRVYYVDLDQSTSGLSSVYADESYKKSSYPILSENPENIVSVDFNGIMDNDTHIVFHDDELKKKFVETYKKELMNLDYETKLKSYPFASIRFNNDFMEGALRKYAGFNYTSDSTTAVNSKWENVYANSLESVGFYPIYPEFKETLALLKEMDVEVIYKFPAEYVESIDVSYNDWENNDPDNNIEEVESYSSETTPKTFTDKRDIEEILDKLVICDSPYKENLNEDRNYAAIINTGNSESSAYRGYNSYGFKKGNIPDIIKK
jgi:hypothetical protein